jgi:hypothetical protein
VHGTLYTPFIGDFKQLAKQHETPTGIVDWYRWLRRETQESGATHQGLSFFWRGPRLTMAIWVSDSTASVPLSGGCAGSIAEG